MIPCIYCSKPVEDVSEGDIPYHVECAMKHFEKLNKEAKECRTKHMVAPFAPNKRQED